MSLFPQRLLNILFILKRDKELSSYMESAGMGRRGGNRAGIGGVTWAISNASGYWRIAPGFSLTLHPGYGAVMPYRATCLAGKEPPKKKSYPIQRPMEKNASSVGQFL
ncbi:hypothetical protein [Silvimonas soli]|uniref:hypothetical protein n=1 Tax=Silvimonas soli TaxID=2980100 RepID=UPI0024B3960F|nr:hypothetical protein [Silvimonas soli]